MNPPPLEAPVQGISSPLTGSKRQAILLPLAVGVGLLLFWDVGLRLSGNEILPTPVAVVRGIGELAEKGLLLKYVVASLFRVTWGFLLAVVVGIPLGLALGWFRWAHEAFNPLLQVLRPISPIAWIPLAILWFGVSDAAPDLFDLPGQRLSDPVRSRPQQRSKACSQSICGPAPTSA